jgi:hypothetical protein
MRPLKLKAFFAFRSLGFHPLKCKTSLKRRVAMIVISGAYGAVWIDLGRVSVSAPSRHLRLRSQNLFLFFC